MFTGIIQEIGHIHNVQDLNGGKTCAIKFASLLPGLTIGDSISVNGVCSTVTEKLSDGIRVDYLEETLSKTTFKTTLTEGNIVNLELCLTPSDSIGGHFISGHVDTVGKILTCEKKDPWGILEVEFPAENAAYLIPKGSIAIDGISLTIATLNNTSIVCHLIPHTLEHTVLHSKKEGDAVNLEFDMIGKYLHRFYSLDKQDN